MNRPEFDEFAALWHDAPTAADQAQFEAYARAARRRGRFLDYLDYAFAIMLLIMMVGGTFVSPNPLTIAVAVPLMITVTWLTWKRRVVRQMANTLNTADRDSFIESCLRNARANLRRNTISLATVPFLLPVALAFKVSVRTGGGLEEVWEAFLLWTQTVRAPITILFMLILVGATLRTRRKIKAEM
jgi:hypothetical protein